MCLGPSPHSAGPAAGAGARQVSTWAVPEGLHVSKEPTEPHRRRQHVGGCHPQRVLQPHPPRKPPCPHQRETGLALPGWCQHFPLPSSPALYRRCHSTWSQLALSSLLPMWKLRFRVGQGSPERLHSKSLTLDSPPVPAALQGSTNLPGEHCPGAQSTGCESPSPSCHPCGPGRLHTPPPPPAPISSTLRGPQEDEGTAACGVSTAATLRGFPALLHTSGWACLLSS